MSGYIEVTDRGQATPFPDRLEDWVGRDNSARIVDLVVDEIDLVAPASTGRSGYRPSGLLQLFSYGYFNRVQSSRAADLLLGGAVNRILWIAACGAALIGTAPLVSAQSLADDDRGVLLAMDPDVVALGATVYRDNCASCHGANLEGQANWRSRDDSGRLPAPPHDETGHTWHHDGKTLFRLTKYGTAALIGDPDYVSNMPIYEGILSDDEITAVLSFIKSTWPEEFRARHDEMDNRQ